MLKGRFIIAFALAVSLIAVGPAAALVQAENEQIPMQSHDFTDVPVAGKEFMEPFINAMYHHGITTGCNPAPLQYCPEQNVTRGEMAVFIGRALGYVQAETDGYITSAYFKNTSAGMGAIGRATNNVGVMGWSQHSYGLYGYAVNAYGLLARSANGTGVYAAAGPDNSGDAFYDLVLEDLGELLAGGTLSLVANDSVWIDLDNDNNSSNYFYIWNGTDAAIFSVDESGNTYSSGNTGAGGTKSAIVNTMSHGTRAMYSVEATEVLFEDMGTAQLVDGVVIIEFDPIFAETVNLDMEYQVFLTPVGGWAELYVAQQTNTFFEVRSTDATTNLKFHYRIVAKRLGYEDVRTEEMVLPER